MDDTTTIQGIIDYYVNCLILQYNDKPKARATIAALVSTVIANGIASDVLNGYNVLTAIGHQLDILGKYADITRFYEGQTFSGFFAFSTYSQEHTPISGQLGFSTYSNFLPVAGKWLQYNQILNQSLALDDSDFRILLLLRIIQNNSNFSRLSIDSAIYNSFGLNVIPDSTGNMVMDYFTSESNAAILQVAIQQGVLPKPMGVRLRYLISQRAPFFGLSTYSGYPPTITGFSTYSNYRTIDGETLAYQDLLTG